METQCQNHAVRPGPWPQEQRRDNEIEQEPTEGEESDQPFFLHKGSNKPVVAIALEPQTHWLAAQPIVIEFGDAAIEVD